MKTIYYTAGSLDGFLATEEDSLAWLFALGTSLEGEKGSDSGYATFIAGVGALAMGSATYEWLLHNPEQVAAETGSPWPYTQPTWVFTTRGLPRIDGADLRFVRGDVSPVHREMRRAAGAGNVWIVGGGELAGQFHDAGLLDEMVVQIGSATLGRGKPLFPRRLFGPSLRLLGLRRLGAELVELRYALKPDPSDPPHPRGDAP
ncbi:dihydrofolate reductase family protein [Thioalkalicoccus limnaeus]|uniref:Dihydrofolate reductase family protein n=1 Tax=Thioalkalicoccus limnaeus TaxID=120681 RepID=A0ABV4BEZ9_9GAMM